MNYTEYKFNVFVNTGGKFGDAVSLIVDEGSKLDVDAINLSDTKGWKKMVRAWLDESKGLIRARTFADRIGMPEVQGNGSGSMNLAGQLQC